MSHVIILAGSAKEANAYRRDANLPTGRAIHASTVTQIEGVVPSEIHTLPGFRKRRDVHAIGAALKRARRKYQDIRYVEIDDRGFVTDRMLEVAFRYNGLRDEAARPVFEVSSNGDISQKSPNDDNLSEDTEVVLTIEKAEAIVSDLDAHDDALAALKAAADDQRVTAAVDARIEHNDEARKTVKRRTRCKDCGALHFKDDPCEPPADPAFFG